MKFWSAILWFTFILTPLNGQPSSSSSNEDLIRTLIQQGKIADAKIEIQRQLAANPNNSEAHFGLGLCYINSKEYSTALVSLNKAINLNPNLKDAYFYRFLANIETSNFQFAMADINQHLKFFSQDTLAHSQKMKLAIQMREYNDAIQEGYWLVDHKFGGDDLILQQIQLLEMQKGPKEQITFLNRVILDNRDNHGWYYHRAQAYFNLGEYEKSLIDLDRFLIAEPKFINALKLRFDNHYFLRNLPKCEIYIQELMDLEPENGLFYSDYGHILLQKGEWNKAIKNFDQAIKYKSDHLGYVYLGRGIARFNLNQKKLACADWEKSLLLGETISKKYLNNYCE